MRLSGLVARAAPLLARRGGAARAGGAAAAAAPLHTSSAAGAKVLAVLYPDPVAGYPPQYARDSIPEVTSYPDGFPAPSLEGSAPGTLLGCVSGALGLREWLQTRGHTLVVTSDKCARCGGGARARALRPASCACRIALRPMMGKWLTLPGAAGTARAARWSASWAQRMC